MLVRRVMSWGIAAGATAPGARRTRLPEVEVTLTRGDRAVASALTSAAWLS